MDYQTKTKLVLPFLGTWMVSNGGRTGETNNHVKFASGDGPKNQIYAYDFRRGHTGAGEKLEEYDVYSEEVIAPGDGVIIQVINGAIDVLPGERDRAVGVGNTVIIDHQNGEFSVLCHFKYNSIQVKVGDHVIQGNLLGLCGNTGNTSEPHIHFHLQDGPSMHTAKPLPAQFSKITVDGEVKTKYEPIRKQMVSNF
ncbi:MAG: M23 family metallopeptidase [Candidatus Gottesmanbacteria bacterium]|nr:M23 family metallopeptidase [Candidatus Gottesmanbacteria bacterium]